jgi:hypothetical protein
MTRWMEVFSITEIIFVVKIPAASGGAFRAGGHYADIARSASTCPSSYVGGICPPNPLTRMPFLPTASSGASWYDFVKNSFQTQISLPKVPSPEETEKVGPTIIGEYPQ